MGKNNSQHRCKLGNDYLEAVESTDDYLEAVESTDNLGLLRVSASPCSYDHHVFRSVHKAYGTTYMILRGLCFRNPTIMRLIFTTYIRPIAEFASLLWTPTSVRSCDRFERVQRAFTKQVAGFYHLPYDRRLQLLNLDTMTIRLKKYKLCTMFKIIHRLIDVPLSDINLSLAVTHTRSNGIRLVLPAPRTNHMLHSYSYSTGKMWNSRPRTVVVAHSISLFKHRLARIDIADL